MRKVLLFAVCMFAMTLVTSCGGASSSPSEVAKECTELMKNKDFEGLVNKMDFGNKEISDEDKELAVAMLKSKGSKMLDQKKGIDSYEVVEETISEDGKNATVKMKITYGDGSTQENKMKFVLVDGKWKPKS